MSLGPLGAAISRRHLHLLVSSMSARGRAISVGPRVVRILREGGWDVQVTVTTPDDDPTSVAHRLGDGASGDPTDPSSARTRPPVPESGPALVGALGGDGYISAVAEGLAGTGGVLVPLPGGRGNDLCRAIGAGADPVARARSLAGLGLLGAGEGQSDLPAERLRGLDGIWVQEAGEGVDERADEGDPHRLVLGVVSFGLEAWANIIANGSRLRSGPLAYAYGALAAPIRFHQADFRAVLDGVPHDMGGWALSVSNSGCIGGGIRIVPSSDPFDGVLEAFHVGHMPLRAALPVLARVVAKRDAEDPAVEVLSVHEMVVTEPVGMPAMADGDQVGTIPLRISVAPAVVDVLI